MKIVFVPFRVLSAFRSTPLISELQAYCRLGLIMGSPQPCCYHPPQSLRPEGARDRSGTAAGKAERGKDTEEA